MSSTFPRLATMPIDSVATQVCVLTVGPWHTREFAIALDNIEEASNWQAVDDLNEACTAIEESATPPELILLAQPLPGHYRQEEVDQLQQLAPLARIVVVAGTWCEGEMRTGKPLWGVLRLYWYELASWWSAARFRLSECLCPPWSMPLDTPNAGRFQAEATDSTTTIRSAIAISTPDPSTYDTFNAALPDYGFSATRLNSNSEYHLRGGIWDGGQLAERELRQLNDFCQRIEDHNGWVVALLDFPRVEHIKQARDAGAKAVFSKPYVMREVVEALR